MIKDVPIGVVEAVNKLDQGHYNEDDQELLETLAAQAAIAIENARLMRDLKNANIELKRLDRMKSDFIAITSHELRTPLGLILGHASFLEGSAPAECQEQVDAITNSAMRLKSIIEDLSSIAHTESDETSLRRTEFSMRDLALEVAERFRKLAIEKRIELHSKLPQKDELKIEADREKLKVALSHIVRNAISFTDAKGRVGIIAERVNGFVKVTVKDSGIGIPKEDVQRVFDRFYQVESHLTRKHGGMGLGLSIAKAMVELHNGQIWCESEEGVGSTFVLLIPRQAKQADAASKVFKTS
jgi:signal transduction histidine kinase